MTLRVVFEKLALAFALLVLVAPAAMFFVWMLSLSVKYEIDNAAYPPILIPEHFAWKNYASVIESNRFGTFFMNSVIVTGLATLFALVIGVPAGYGIARMQATKAAIVILIARITPGLSYLIPLFLLFQWLGLLGTLWPQIIIHLVVTVPIVIWIMIGYFETTPMELEEAAVIDGAGALADLSSCRAADRQARHCRGVDPVGDLLLEQFRVRHRAGGARDAHPPRCGLQHDLVRTAELGAARGRGADRDAASAALDAVRATPDRRRIDRRRGEGRLSPTPCGSARSSTARDWQSAPS